MLSRKSVAVNDNGNKKSGLGKLFEKLGKISVRMRKN